MFYYLFTYWLLKKSEVIHACNLARMSMCDQDLNHIFNHNHSRIDSSLVVYIHPHISIHHIKQTFSKNFPVITWKLLKSTCICSEIHRHMSSIVLFISYSGSMLQWLLPLKLLKETLPLPWRRFTFLEVQYSWQKCLILEVLECCWQYTDVSMIFP